MPQSLNQITDALLTFARSHGQINTARFCAPYQWHGDKTNLYPLLAFDLVSVRKVPNQLAYNFELYVSDRAEEGHESEVLSDAILIANDVLSWLGNQEFYLDGEPQMTPFVDDTADVLAGVRMEFTVRATVPLDRCAIPYTPDESNIYLTTEESDLLLTESGDTLIKN